MSILPQYRTLLSVSSPQMDSGAGAGEQGENETPENEQPNTTEAEDKIAKVDTLVEEPAHTVVYDSQADLVSPTTSMAGSKHDKVRTGTQYGGFITTWAGMGDTTCDFEAPELTEIKQSYDKNPYKMLIFHPSVFDVQRAPMERANGAQQQAGNSYRKNVLREYSQTAVKLGIMMYPRFNGNDYINDEALGCNPEDFTETDMGINIRAKEMLRTVPRQDLIELYEGEYIQMPYDHGYVERKRLAASLVAGLSQSVLASPMVMNNYYPWSDYGLWGQYYDLPSASLSGFHSGIDVAVDWTSPEIHTICPGRFYKEAPYTYMSFRVENLDPRFDGMYVTYMHLDRYGHEVTMPDKHRAIRGENVYLPSGTTIGTEAGNAGGGTMSQHTHVQLNKTLTGPENTTASDCLNAYFLQQPMISERPYDFIDCCWEAFLQRILMSQMLHVYNEIKVQANEA